VSKPLTDDDLVQIERRARRSGAANCWTGTSGTLASDVMRLLAERNRLLIEIARRQEAQEPYWRHAHD
jgi:hypothetical protein